jgi:hypothetical protein
MFGRVIFSLVVLAIIPVFFFSCGSDDGPPDPGITANLFYAGNRLSITKAIVLHYEQNEGEVNSHDWDLYLVGEGITYNPTSKSFSGQGDMIYLDLNTTSTQAYSGNFTYQAPPDRSAPSLSMAQVGRDYNFTQGTGTLFSALSGQVSVAPDGTDILVEINTFFPQGRILQGTYNGPVEVFDLRTEGFSASAISIDGIFYRLTQGYLDNYGENDNGISHDFDFNLTSDAIVYDAEEESFSGNGLVFYMDLNSPVGGTFQTGTYTFQSTREPFSMVAGTLFLSKPGGLSRRFVVTSGSVQIGKSGETWEMTYTFQVQETQLNGEGNIGSVKAATGNYLGGILEF